MSIQKSVQSHVPTNQLSGRPPNRPLFYSLRIFVLPMLSRKEPQLRTLYYSFMFFLLAFLIKKTHTKRIKEEPNVEIALTIRKSKD
jgi:hypothetical protein